MVLCGEAGGGKRASQAEDAKEECAISSQILSHRMVLLKRIFKTVVRIVLTVEHNAFTSVTILRHRRVSSSESMRLAQRLGVQGMRPMHCRLE